MRLKGRCFQASDWAKSDESSASWASCLYYIREERSERETRDKEDEAMRQRGVKVRELGR